ncbi:hypothetical protein BCR44DRAFT_298661, partial [Catenaria anguillulae PL171]
TTHKRGGTSPHWDQSLAFPIDPVNPPQFLNIVCLDKDTLTADDFIGQAAVSLPAALGSTGAFDGWIQLGRGKLHGKPAGEVHLQIRYEASHSVAKEKEYHASSYRSSSCSSISESEGYDFGSARDEGQRHPPIPTAAEHTGSDTSRGKSCKVGGAIVGIGAGAVALAGAAMDKWGEHKMKKTEKKAKKKQKHGFLGGFKSGFKEECGNSAGEALAPDSEEVVAAVTEGVVGGIVESVLGGLFGG